MSERLGGRGWGRVLGLSLACIALSTTVQPALLVFVPFGLLALGLPPRRPVTVLAGLLLLGAGLFGMRATGLAAVERAWALLAGGWFLLVIVLMPRQGFVMRGLVAVAMSFATALGFLAARPGALARVDEGFTARLREAASAVAAAWAERGGDGGLAGQLSTAIERAADLQVMLYPALLGLATLAGLGVAWWAWGRLALRPEGGLSPLREFRFSDGLIWLFILGVVLVLAPLAPQLVRAGSNLLAFMVALYALRGLAVAVFVWGVPGPGGMVVAALATVLLYPFVVATSVLLGLFDTWLDLRTKRPASQGPEA